MSRRIPLALAAVLTFACGTRPPADTTPTPPDPLLAPDAVVRPFEGVYPLEMAWPFHVGLVHWLDSLASVEGAGLTAGKTAPVHRGEYLERFGKLDDADRLAIERYAEVRRAYVARFRRSDVNGLSRAFLESRDLDEALVRVEALVGERAAADVEAALLRFSDRYREIWRDAAAPRRFVGNVLDHTMRDEMGELLARTAEFFGVDPAVPTPPRMLVVPTPAGTGTHAQAIDDSLLLEVRPRDTLLDQSGAIVHENAHFLFMRVEPARLASWERLAAGRGRRGVSAWYLLIEALPTALGQGVAERMFIGDAWSVERPWYHRDDVDRYAKALYPLVGQALAEHRPLDEELIGEMLDLWVRRRR